MLPRFTRPVCLEFAGTRGAASVLPLLQLESAEFEAVLGQPVVFAEPSGRNDHMWRLEVDPAVAAPELQADPHRPALRSVVPSEDPEHLIESINLLHSLAHHPGDSLAATEAGSYREVIERIRAEVAMVYPYLGLRGLDWDRICSRHEGLESLTGEAFWEAAQAWVAELGDAHTSIVRPGPGFHPSYRARMTADGALLTEVPDGSAAREAGVRPGWVIPVDDPERWLRTTGASPQHHTEVAARRLLRVTGTSRTFRAVGGAGQQATWEETERPLAPLAVTGGVVRIRTFVPGVAAHLAAALDALSGREGVTLDLRGNVGGQLAEADAARRLLVREPATFGTVQFSTGTGSVAPESPLTIEPARNDFTGQVRILVDAMTYSAAEDFVHPLVGLPHVSIIGGPTGGGSGRPHSRPLMEGYRLNVSTAITRTRHGDAIEYFGIRGATGVDR